MPNVLLVWLVEWNFVERNLKERIETNIPDSLGRGIVPEVPWPKNIHECRLEGSWESRLALGKGKREKEEIGARTMQLADIPAHISMGLGGLLDRFTGRRVYLGLTP